MRNLLLLIFLAATPILSAQIQPCTIRKDEPVCNKAAFKQSLSAARNVAISPPGLAPYAAKPLTQFLADRGKQIVSSGDRPDLTFAFLFPSTEGVLVGPAGVVLVRLRVYGPGPGTPLLWEETYTDQPDVPLQAAVMYVLKQFRERFPPS